MPGTSSTYRGHVIEVGGTEAAPTLAIDGQAIPVSRIVPGLYATSLLPHSNFPSLDELAHAVIDHSPQFSGRRDLP